MLMNDNDIWKAASNNFAIILAVQNCAGGSSNLGTLFRLDWKVTGRGGGTGGISKGNFLCQRKMREIREFIG